VEQRQITVDREAELPQLEHKRLGQEFLVKVTAEVSGLDKETAAVELEL
jgi:hypothetical protein